MMTGYSSIFFTEALKVLKWILKVVKSAFGSVLLHLFFIAGSILSLTG